MRNAEPEGRAERMKMGPVRAATREAAWNGSRARAMRAQTVATKEGCKGHVGGRRRAAKGEAAGGCGKGRAERSMSPLRGARRRWVSPAVVGRKRERDRMVGCQDRDRKIESVAVRNG